MSTKIICVFNKKEVFEKIVRDNQQTTNCEIFGYDNTSENIAITKRYNEFIEKNIKEDSPDFWCAFIHQDFGFQEDMDLKLENLDKNYIYGPIGVKFNYPVTTDTREGFDPDRLVVYGMIAQRINQEFITYGEYITQPTIVDSLDCCCIIMHSSLIKKYNLRFDENLSFHMYAEELCYRAKKDYGIETKTIQTKCFHLGIGVLNDEFKASVKYLKDKFKIHKIPSTCPN